MRKIGNLLSNPAETIKLNVRHAGGNVIALVLVTLILDRNNNPQLDNQMIRAFNIRIRKKVY